MSEALKLRLPRILKEVRVLSAAAPAYDLRGVPLSVASLATLSGTQQGVEDIFTCEDGQGTTGILPLGDYTVVVSILEDVTDAVVERNAYVLEYDYGHKAPRWVAYHLVPDYRTTPRRDGCCLRHGVDYAGIFVGGSTTTGSRHTS